MAGAAGGKSHQPAITASEWDRSEELKQIIEWRRWGKSYQWIADQIGKSKSHVFDVYNEALKANTRPAIEQAREEATQRYEGLMEELRSLAQAETLKEKPDVNTLRMLVESMQKMQIRLDKLLGLEAPIKTEVEAVQTVTYKIELDEE